MSRNLISELYHVLLKTEEKCNETEYIYLVKKDDYIDVYLKYKNCMFATMKISSNKLFLSIVYNAFYDIAIQYSEFNKEYITSIYGKWKDEYKDKGIDNEKFLLYIKDFILSNNYDLELINNYLVDFLKANLIIEYNNIISHILFVIKKIYNDFCLTDMIPKELKFKEIKKRYDEPIIFIKDIDEYLKNISMKEIFDKIVRKVKIITLQMKYRRNIFIIDNEDSSIISISLNKYKNLLNKFIIKIDKNNNTISFKFEKSYFGNNKEISVKIKDEYYGTEIEYKTPIFAEKNHWIESSIKVINNDIKRFLAKILQFITSIEISYKDCDSLINKYFPVDLMFDETYPNFIEDKLEEAWLKAFCIFVGYNPSISFKNFITDTPNDRIIPKINNIFTSLLDKTTNKINDHIKLTQYYDEKCLEVCGPADEIFSYRITDNYIEIYLRDSKSHIMKSIGYIEYNKSYDSFIFNYRNFKKNGKNYYPYDFIEIKSSVLADFRLALISILNIFESALEMDNNIHKFLEDSFKVHQYINGVLRPMHAINFIADQGIINFVKYEEEK